MRQTCLDIMYSEKKVDGMYRAVKKKYPAMNDYEAYRMVMNQDFRKRQDYWM